MRYLLDTNVLSEPLKPDPSPALLKKLRAHEGQCATAAVVWHELVFGTARLPRSRRKTHLERYLREVIRETVPVLPYDEAAASWHARERARLTKRGRTPSFADGQIAAIAAVNDLVVVTANVKDFKPFDVTVEDWR